MINGAIQNAYDGTGLSYSASLYLIGKKRLEEAPAALKYELLDAMYNDNGLYDSVGRALADQDIWLQSLKPLGNPTSQVIEFYAGHLMADLDLTEHIQPEQDAIVEPLQDVWRWSNFDAAKILLSRQTPEFGDSFILVRKPADQEQVRIELLNAADVVDFDTDKRGYVTWIRIDVPHAYGESRDASGLLSDYHHVEVWDKWSQTYRRWQIDPKRMSIIDADLSRLGQPAEEIPFKQLGVDFVPVVHIPFRDVGADRGQAAVWPSISKIVELDTIVTALHQNYFAYDRPTWAIESMGMDSQGRIQPPPTVAASNGTSNGSAAPSDRDVVYLGKDRLWRLPSGWTLRSTVPDIQFEAGLKIIQDYWSTLERRMPELIYSRIGETGGDLSGRAVRFMLSGAIKRAEEARNNLEQGLVRAHQMALTIGKNTGVFTLNGSFDDGGFAHKFAKRAIIPESELEEAQTELAKAQAAQGWGTAGLPLADILKRTTNLSDDEIAEILTRKADEVNAAADFRGGEVQQ